MYIARDLSAELLIREKTANLGQLNAEESRDTRSRDFFGHTDNYEQRIWR